MGFLLIGFLLLWYVTKDHDREKIIHEMQNANYWWVIISMFAGVISHIFRALRWNLLISSLGYNTKTSVTFYALMTGYLFNIAVPRLGEISRCGALHRTSNAPFSILFGTVLSERFFDMICLILLISLTVLLQLPLLDDFLKKYIYYPLIQSFENNYIIFIIAFCAVTLLIILLYKFFKKHFRKPTRGKKMSWLKMQIKGMISGVKTIRYMRKKWTFLFYTLMIWFNYFLMVCLCFYAIEGTSHLGLREGVTVLSLGSLGIVAPVPGGIGTYHFIVIKTLTELYNIIPEAAVSYAYIAHASQIVMLLTVGLFSLIMISFIRKKTSYFKNNPNNNINHANDHVNKNLQE